MTKAAGILFVSINGNALFLRRTESAPDCPGCWDFPGGGREGDETAEECATRECREEIGFVPEGVRVFHTRTMQSSTPVPGVAGAGASAILPVSSGAPAAEATVLSPPPVNPAMPIDVDFTTFLQRVTNEFTPELNDEHDGFCWAPVNAPPGPIHPGCLIALDRLSMNELDVARAIADGRLTSPQRYENMMLWAIRITGTGASYRPKVNEFVYRDGENHLTPDALARFNGLAVIFKHPKDNLLTSDEFRKRIVGTIFLPYVAQDEAWGIAKIYDDDANRRMLDEELSTSPGVNFKDFSVNRVLHVEELGKVLVEGDPSLMDHVAICALGVWDKGGEPSGIRSEAREDSAMADKDDDKAKDDAAKKDTAKDDAHRDDTARKDNEDDKDKGKDDSARKDADGGVQPDKNLSHMLDAINAVGDAVKGLGRRMDAFEEKEKDRDDAARKDAAKKDDDEKDKGEAGKTAADKAKDDAARDDKSRKDAKSRKDGDKEAEGEQDKAKTDARTDSMHDDIRKRIEDVNHAVQTLGAQIRPLSDDDHSMLADAWSRADDVFTAFGQKTPRPIPGETSMLFRRRIVKALLPHSPTWKTIDVASKAFTDDASFGIIESQVLSEASVTARSPATVKAGELRAIERKQDGHTIREFVGEPRAWMDAMAGPVQLRGEGAFKTGNLGQGR